MTKKQLQKNIMRRVYYVYTLRVVTNPVLLHGGAMFALLLALTQFVSAADVLRNISEIPVGHLGIYFYGAVTNTEAWTLIVVGLLIFAAFSFRMQLHSGGDHEMQTV